MKASAQPCLYHAGVCSVLANPGSHGLPCPFQGSAQFRATLSTLGGSCKGRLCLYPINCSYSFWGECHYSFSFLSTTPSIYILLCLCFPLSLLLSLHYSDTSWDMVIFFVCLFVCLAFVVWHFLNVYVFCLIVFTIFVT